MSDKELKATITGVDKATPVFAKVADGAKKMGTAVDDAGKKGTKGLTDQGRSAADLNTRMAALGAATAVAASVLATWSRSSQEADAIQRQLEASVAATGEEYSVYADRIAEAGAAAVRLGQDDEAASQAISALTQVTGSANVALDQMGLVMDLAAAKHMSLEAAATLVGKVIGGNVGLLNRQGFAIDENATATEALAQVQTAVAGQAEAAATSYARLREEFSNITDAIGGTVGGFAPLLAMLPGVSVGFTAVGSAVGALAPNLTKANAAAGLLNLAMGPVGLVAAAAVAGIAIYELVQRFDDANLSAKEAEGQIKSFDEVLANLGKTGTDNKVLADLGAYREVLVELALNSQRASDTIAFAWAKAAEAQTAYQEASINNKDAETQRALLAQADAAREYAESLDGVILNEEQIAEVGKDFVDIFTDMNPLNADLVVAQLERLKFQLDEGIISADQYVAAVDDLNEHSDSYGLTIEEIVANQRLSVGVTQDLTSTIDALTAAQDRQAAAQARSSGAILEGPARAMSRMKQLEAAAYSMATATQSVAQATHEQTAEQAAAEVAMNGLEGAAYSMAGAQQDVAVQTNAARAALDAIAQSARTAAEALLGTSSFASKIRPVDIDVRGGDKVTGTAADLQKTQSILGSVLGTFQQLDSLGQASEQATSIATNLIGEPGELGILDSLLKKGRISQGEFNAAVKAGNQISKEAGAIENDLNTIRAKQLPLLADADRQYGNLIDRISHMTAENAQATLGFMDSTESMKAQNAMAVAAAAAQTEVGSAARASATAIIEGAVAADPVLEAMLTSIGLVARDHEGNLVINFDNADELNASTDALTTAIDNLTTAIKNIPPSANSTITVLGTDVAVGQVGEVITAIGQVQSKTVTVAVNTVNTVTNQTGGTAGGAVTGSSRLGGVLNFANGGVVSLAEAGPELLRFANGGMAMAMNSGLYAVPNQTLVHTAPATKDKMAGWGGGQTFNITVQGDINGMSGVNEVMAAFKIAAREHFAGYRS